MFRKTTSILVMVSFLLSSMTPVPKAQAGNLAGLPKPGSMVNLSPAYAPVLIKGLKVHPENPLLLDFILDTGHSGFRADSPQLRKESEKLIKYFLATLTIPEKNLWVNLSPYEKDRMIPDELGQTELGRDMLAEDYILKQLTASLVYPEKDLGKAFWQRVYAKAQQTYGTTQIPVNTFNKVWIIADKANVYVNNNTAYVVGAHLKAMLEEDYLSLSKHHRQPAPQGTNLHAVATQIVREIILPEIEKEVNRGKNFANLRQIFYSMILATWYKQNLKEAFLNKVYANKTMVNGLSFSKASVGTPEQIYRQYLQAYKKGVFNYIKEDVSVDGTKQETLPHKYFSGGLKDLAKAQLVDKAQAAVEILQHPGDGLLVKVSVRAEKVGDTARINHAVTKLQEILSHISVSPSGGRSLISVRLPTGTDKAMATALKEVGWKAEISRGVLSFKSDRPVESIRADLAMFSDPINLKRIILIGAALTLNTLVGSMYDNTLSIVLSSIIGAGVAGYLVDKKKPTKAEMKTVAISLWTGFGAGILGLAFTNSYAIQSFVDLTVALVSLSFLPSEQKRDKAMRVDQMPLSKLPTNGGIDLNAQNMQMGVSGQKIAMHFDQAMMAQFEAGDFSGVRAVILGITALSSIVPLLDL